MEHIDYQYNQLFKTIYQDGYIKENRTGDICKAYPHMMIRHNMENGFPILQGRKLPIKSTLVELEGFLHGITSKKWYQDRGCKFWDYWACPTIVDREHNETGRDKKELARELDYLGPIYGFQWNSRYLFDGVNYYSQLANILHKLKTDPNDRRMVCSAWMPEDFDQMALPPCHVMWHVTVIGGKINLCWFQRSCDLALGISANIVSYATLLLILSKYSGFKPGILTGFLSDVHYYMKHEEGLKEQYSRELKLSKPILNITHDNPIELFNQGPRDRNTNFSAHLNWTHKDYELLNYHPHDKLTFEVSV